MDVWQLVSMLWVQSCIQESEEGERRKRGRRDTFSDSERFELKRECKAHAKMDLKKKKNEAGSSRVSGLRKKKMEKRNLWKVELRTDRR